MKIKPLYQHIFFFLLILVYTLIYFIIAQPAIWSNDLVISDDFPQHLLWLFTFGETNFQLNDPLVEFSVLIQPWGYYALNRFLVLFFDPLTISKFFSFFPLLMTSGFTFLLLKKRFGWVVAFAGMVLISHLALERIVGFFARSFAIPLLLGFLYFWVEKREKGVAMMLLLSALFYPVSWLLECGIIGLNYAYWFFTRKQAAKLRKEQHFWILGAVLLCGGLILLKTQQIRSSPLAGSFFDRLELTSMAEFQPGGRVDFSAHLNVKAPLEFPWHWYLRLSYAKIILLLFGAYLIRSIIKKSEQQLFDWTLLSLFLSGTLLFYLAILFLPKFFLPGRYLYYSYLPFASLLFMRILGLGKKWWCKPLIGGLLLCLVTFSTFHKNFKKNRGLSSYNKYEILYKKIQSIPKPVLIAGPPAVCSQIPTFCQQSVLFSDEAAHGIYFKNYFQHFEAKIVDFISAYTAEDIDTVIGFIQKYQIDYLLIDRSFFTSGYMGIHQPHRDRLKQITKGRTSVDYALGNLPDNLLEKGGKRYDLLDCKKLIYTLGVGHPEGVER